MYCQCLKIIWARRRTAYHTIIYDIMGRKRAADDRRLRFRVVTYVNGRKYQELQSLLQQNAKMDMSTLVRYILENRQVRIYVHDETLDHWMEELSRLRTEIKAIGVNINQITRNFNTYPDMLRKVANASSAFEQYRKLQPQIEGIWEVLKKLNEKWLSE